MKTDKTLALFFFLFLTDILILIFAYKIAYEIRISLGSVLLPLHDYTLQRYVWVGFFVLALLFYEGIYFERIDFWRETKQILKAIFFSFVAVFMVLALAKLSFDFSRAFLVIYFVVLALLLPFSKRIIKRILFSFDTFKVGCEVLGKNDSKEEFLEEIAHNWYLGLQSVDASKEVAFIISSDFSPQELSEIIEQKLVETKSVYIVPYLYRFDFSHTKNVDFFNLRLSAFHLQNRLLSKKNLWIKELVDKIMAFLIAPLVLLLHLFISLAIKMDSKGAVFYKQKRIGKDGRLFSCYKYRTMHEEQHKLLSEYLQKNPSEIAYYEQYHKYRNDPRITKVGSFLRKTSLDELPQFFNVLRGDMSLIGPRPYMPSEEDAIHKEHKDNIIRVKPGITGLWQVSGRNNLTFSQRVDLDVWYIQNWSLWMDFVIFMKTIKVVFSKVGAK